MNAKMSPQFYFNFIQKMIVKIMWCGISTISLSESISARFNVKYKTHQFKFLWGYVPIPIHIKFVKSSLWSFSPLVRIMFLQLMHM